MIGTRNEAYARAAGEGPKLWVVGQVFTFKATAEETGGAYTTWEIALSPGEGVPAHIHDREDEMWYVLDGEVEFHLGERIVTAAAGMFLHGPKGARHAFFNRTDAPARILLMAVPSGIERFFEEIGEPVPATPGDPPPVDLERVIAVGHKYGIHFDPLPEEG